MASQNIARLGVVLGLDSGELVREMDEAQKKFKNFTNEIRRDTNDAAKVTLQLTEATERYGKTLTKVEEIELQIRQGRFQYATETVKKALLEKAAAYDKVASAAKAANEAEMAKGGLKPQQLAALGYQTTDIITGLAGGQNPLMVMLQQGGQLRDQFGGFKPLFQGIAEVMTPFRIGMLGSAAAVGSLAAAFYQGSEETKKFHNAMILTNDFAGISAQRFDGLAKSVSLRYNTAISDSREMMQQLVASGQFTYKSLESVASVIAKVASLSGQSASDVASKLIPSLDGSAESAKRLNEQYHFLTLAQYKHIEALNMAGKTQEAAKYTADALNEKLQKQQEYLGYIEKSWKAVKSAASDFWDYMKSIGREEDPTVAAIKNEVAMMESLMRTLGANAINSPQYQKALAEYKRLSAELEADEKARQQKADSEAAKNAGIDAYAGAGGLKQSIQIRKNVADIYAKIDYESRAAGLDKIKQIELERHRDIEMAKNEISKRNRDQKFAFVVENEEELEARTLEIAASAARKKQDIYREVNKNIEESLKNEKYAIDQEKEKTNLYMANLFSSQEELRIAEDKLRVAHELEALSRKENLKEDKRAEFEERIRMMGEERQALIRQQETLKQLQEINSAVYSNMTQSLEDFVRTGKLSFRDFAVSVVNALISIQVRAAALKAVTGLGKVFDFVSNSGSEQEATAGLFGGFRADGGPVDNSMAYIVGEQGPELFVPSGSGTIIPNNMLGQQNQGPTINYNGPYIANMSAIDTQSANQFLAKNKMGVYAANQSATRSIPASR